MIDRQKLGKGLSVLIRQSALEDRDKNKDFMDLDFSQITPNKYQPRIEFDSKELEELAASIRINGVIQPIMVRSLGQNQYELVAGERRFRASQMAGLKTIPAYIKNISDRGMLECALIENIQRSDLNPIEEARAYERLMKEFDLTQEVIAKQVGKERSSVANSLRLLELPKEVRDMISEGKISVGHAKILLTIPVWDHQIALAKRVIEKGISVRELDLLAKKATQPRKARMRKREPVWVDLEDRLKRSLGTKVSIETGRKGGKIMIEYYSNEDLERLMEIMLGWNQQG